MADVLGKILYTEEDIRKRAEELGAQITEDYAGEELIVLGTLRGAVMWMCDLLKCINLDTKIDFISASSYGSATQTSGVVRITRDVDMDLELDHKLSLEYSGIRNWMMEGYSKLEHDHFIFPGEEGARSVESYIDNELYVQAFFTSRGYRFEKYTGSTERAWRVSSSALYSDFEHWCREWCVPLPAQTTFGREIATMPNASKRRMQGGVVYYIYSDKPISYGTQQ